MTPFRPIVACLITVASAAAACGETPAAPQKVPKAVAVATSPATAEPSAAAPNEPAVPATDPAAETSHANTPPSEPTPADPNSPAAPEDLAPPADDPPPVPPKPVSPKPEEPKPDAPPPPPPPAAEDPPAPPVPAPAPDAAEVASDAKARAILAATAERQRAGDLAAEGALESFHVVFHKATFERDKTNAAGETTTQLVETDENGLVFDWKAGSIRTSVTIDGATTTKAWYEPRKIGWINDGKKTASLLGTEFKADHDQLMYHRTVVRQLLDVAILGKLLADPSPWSVLADSAPYEGTVAIARAPAEGSAAFPITLWIANASPGTHGDVVAASIPPRRAGDVTVFYRFSYNDEFPQVRRRQGDGAMAPVKLRFPFGVSVYEQGADDAKPRKVLEVFAREVGLNSVGDSDFAAPK